MSALSTHRKQTAESKMKLLDYVKKEFFELPECDWDDDMIVEFIHIAAKLDTDVHEAIKDVDFDDLNDSMFDEKAFNYEVFIIKKLMKLNAKAEIKELLKEIAEDERVRLEDAESDHAEDARQERLISDHEGY